MGIMEDDVALQKRIYVVYFLDQRTCSLSKNVNTLVRCLPTLLSFRILSK